jgi:hypothetical protein
MKRELILLGLIVACFLATSLDAKKSEKKTLLQEFEQEEVQIARKESKRADASLDVNKLNAVANGPADEKRCWLQSYGRGVGRPLSQCPANTELGGAICYPHCNPGYSGVSFACWQNCPDGYRDDGVSCAKPASYGRGAGKLGMWFDACNNENQPKGCEWTDGLVYPKCRDNFHNVGCCTCSPDCPVGMTDSGVSCTKGTYTRTAGVPMICKPNEQMDVGLCYDYCKVPYKGIGPVCWGACPAGYNQCGALCMEESTCTDYLLDFLSPITKIIQSAVEKDASGVVEGMVDIVKNLIYPICDSDK